MNTSKKNITPTSFMNVFVTAIPELDPSTGKTTYKTTFTPEALEVRLPDTVINYQLISPTPDDVKIKKLTIKPDSTDQFSNPSISTSGKMATLSDANTIKETFNLTLYFSDKDNVEFFVDPEVTNDPDPY